MSQRADTRVVLGRDTFTCRAAAQTLGLERLVEMVEVTPPFSALRALEAATRHRSFTWAARELNITHSAVSQAVRRLETDLGARLFERRGGAMEPSEAALRLAQSYSAAARDLTSIIHDITGGADASSLSVGMPAAIARLWLSHRLARLAQAIPDVEVSISTATRQPADLDIELLLVSKLRSIDEPLAEMVVAPVCAPDLAPRLTTPEAIAAAPLLADGAEAWAVWSARFAPGLRVRANTFDDTGLMLDAAAAGAGVAMTHLLAAQSYLATGELRLLPFTTPWGRTLVLRSHAGPTKRSAGERFGMWLKLELARDAAQRRTPTTPSPTQGRPRQAERRAPGLR